MINLLRQLFLEKKNAAYEFVKAILKEYEYCKKAMKKNFKQKFDHE